MTGRNIKLVNQKSHFIVLVIPSHFMSKKLKQTATWSVDDLPELRKARTLWETAPLKALGMFALLDAARALGSAHHLPQAKVLLEKVTPYALQTSEGTEHLGQSYRMAQMPDEAVPHFIKALKSPQQLESVIELVVYYERRHQTEKHTLNLRPYFYLGGGC